MQRNKKRAFAISKCSFFYLMIQINYNYEILRLAESNILINVTVVNAIKGNITKKWGLLSNKNR
jgi:hypothetical protein